MTAGGSSQVLGRSESSGALDRACRVVGIVTLCTPNGFGDLILNLKDPSGTIDASVHKKVLSNENFSKSLSVGSVIFLKQVAVLRPSNTVCYLNVTQKNVEKVLQKDSVSPWKQVVSSSSSQRQIQQPDHGDNMEREAGAETSDGVTAILSKISRTKEGQMAELLSDNGSAAKAIKSSILRTNKDTHGVQNHHEKLSEQMDSSSQMQKLPGFNSSEQLQKIISTSINPANCQLKQGGTKYGISSEAQSSTEDIMRKLIGGETMMPSSKEITVAEGSHHHLGTPDASMDADASCSSEKPQEIGLEKMVEGYSREHVSNINRDYEHQQQNQTANTRCPQPILGGSSVMSSSRDCTQAFSVGNLRRLADDDWMQPSRKKQKSDAIVSDGNATRRNDNIDTLSMGAEIKYGLDDITEDFHCHHDSVRKLEHEHKDLHAASAGSTLQPTKENCSISVTSGTPLTNHKMVSVPTVAKWTDEQLSQLFDDDY